LHEVSGHEQVLLVRADLDIVRPNNWLVLIRVIKADWVVQVADINGGDVVAKGERKVSELTVIGDVGVDG
jgi:hypothetical protein